MSNPKLNMCLTQFEPFSNCAVNIFQDIPDDQIVSEDNVSRSILKMAREFKSKQ